MHTRGIYEICETLTQKIYNIRNHRDEVPDDLHKEIHKWAFDCMGEVIFPINENIFLVHIDAEKQSYRISKNNKKYAL